MTPQEQYESEGYTILKNVIDTKLALTAQDHVQWLLKQNTHLRPEQLGHDLARTDAFWYRLVADERILDAIEPFIGPNIALFATHYICKPPGDGQAVLWHQDGSYWPLEPMDVLTVWLSCGTTDRENGCMRVIPSTQDLDLQEMKENTSTANVLNSSIDDSFVDDSGAVDIALGPGDISIHHPNVIHGSEPNVSDRWRYGLTIRYIPTTTRLKIPDAGCAFLLRGEAVEGINTYLPIPKFDDSSSFGFDGAEAWPPSGPGLTGWKA